MMFFMVLLSGSYVSIQFASKVSTLLSGRPYTHLSGMPYMPLLAATLGDLWRLSLCELEATLAHCGRFGSDVLANCRPIGGKFGDIFWASWGLNLGLNFGQF